MKELLCKALEEVYESEFDKYKDQKPHFFSFRHRRMMRELFRRFEKEKESAYIAPTYSYEPRRKRPAALIIAIAVSVLISIAAGAIAIYSFGFKKQSDHTIVFSENIESSPSIIEYVYTIDPLPEGFKESSRTIGSVVSDTTYQNDESTLLLAQTVKKLYICNYNTEGYEIEKLDVNGHDGFFIDFKNASFLVWDNDDYVLELYGTLDKDELLDLAKRTKIKRFEN